MREKSINSERFQLSWTITSSQQLQEAIREMKYQLIQKIGVQEGFTLVDLGCGPGNHPPSFTVCLAEHVGETGRVVGVDITDENVTEFYNEAKEFNVEGRLEFMQGDAVNLIGIIEDNFVDMVVSYRFLEEFMRPNELSKLIKEMVRIVKPGGKVCIIELSTQPRNKAEELYIRLHRDWGDSFFEAHEITELLKENQLINVTIETFTPNIWFSPQVAEVEFWEELREEIILKLGSLTKKHGMKYPPMFIVSGIAPSLKKNF